MSFGWGVAFVVVGAVLLLGGILGIALAVGRAIRIADEEADRADDY